jgi:hypothetical protein
MRHRHLFFASIPITLVFAAACSESHVPADSTDASRGACVAAYEPCTTHDDCCAELYCTGPYGPTECAPVAPDGTSCVEGRECASGVCESNVCGGAPPGCVPAGAGCLPHLGCCEGTTCRDGACLAPRPDGEACAVAADCASNVCSDNRCGAPVTDCLSADASDCDADGARCCEGTYCEVGGYLRGYCLPLLADGELCAVGLNRCVSGACADGMCRAAECVATGTECPGGTHAECCTGFCDFGLSYGPGVCRERLAAGEECYDHLWCASLSCIEHRCS